MEDVISAHDLVVSCLAKTVGLEEHEIDITINLSDLGVDSLSFLRLKTMLEAKLKMPLPDDFEYDDVMTGEEVLARIERQLEPKAS